MTYWLVTTFDENRTKEQFHVEAPNCADAMDWVAHEMVHRKRLHDQVEVHVQKITPEEKDALVRRRP